MRNTLTQKLTQTIGSVITAFGLLGLMVSAEAQAVYVPPAQAAPTLSSVAGLTAALAQLQARTGKPLIVSTYQGMSSYHNLQNGATNALFGSTTNTAVLARVKVVCPYGAINPQPVYFNFSTSNNGEISNWLPAVAPTLSFAVEDAATGNVYPGTFGGKRSTPLDNVGPITGDPVPIVIPAGGFFYERTMLQFTAGANEYAVKGFAGTGDPLQGQTAAPSTLDPATAAAPSGGQTYNYSAAAWVGQQYVSGPAIVAQGDSRMSIPDYAVPFTTGYFRQLFLGVTGLFCGDVSGNGYSTLQSPAGIARSKMYAYATHVYIEHGTNDQTGSTASIVANNLIGRGTVEIRKAVGFGAKIVMETIAPTLGNSSPLSGMADVPGNQIFPATDAGRRCYNDWIRGVSIASLNTNYAAAGIVLPAGTVTAAQAGMTSYVEIADLLEGNPAGAVVRNGGCWRVPSGAYFTGTATGGTASTITGTSFGSNNLYGMILKYTSGANSGVYTYVSAASSSTLITVVGGQNAAGTAVTITAPASGDTFSVYGAYTLECRLPSSSIVGGVHTMVSSGLLSTATFN